MSNHPYYATLARAKQELKATTTGDDAILLDNVADVSQRLDGLLNPQRRRPYFTPTVETRRIPITRRTVNSVDSTLALGAANPLLQLTSVVLGTDTITANVSAFPSDLDLIRTLRYDPGTNTRSWYDAYANQTVYAPAFALVTGVWGYHRDYANAWTAVTTLAGGLTADATSVTVTSASDISPGALLRVNDEYLTVTAVATNTLTVRRGANATTAAAHDDGDGVDVWAVERPIARVVARQAGLLYARRGAYEVMEADGLGGQTAFPRDLLLELRAVVTGYQYG